MVYNYLIEIRIAKSPFHGSITTSGTTALSISPLRPKLELDANEFPYTGVVCSQPPLLPKTQLQK